MKYFKFAKLVRDKILPHMESNNQIARGARKLSDSEFVQELIKKVLEESNEMINVSDKNELKKELADVYEVLDYLKDVLDLTDEELEDLKKQKRDKNGGFSDRIYIEDVGVEEDNKWYQYYLDNPQKYPEVK
ncbi:MAG: nucleoside triphosphate pyrophosphohydrolase [Candidatus Delongbacteria bacterium]|nr:nucleoside triphosphate pyrophosphohydrolase [Candidatus Delongbacteria bacterium]